MPCIYTVVRKVARYETQASSKAQLITMSPSPRDVRFTPESGHQTTLYSINCARMVGSVIDGEVGNHRARRHRSRLSIDRRIPTEARTVAPSEPRWLS
jgi:hypothetical protein